MTSVNRSSSVIVLCLLVMCAPSPSEGQGAKANRAEWKKLDSAEESARYKALDAIPVEDQALLEDIALNDRVPGIRAVATRRLRDQTLLARLATSDPEGRVRSAATSKMTDPQLLLRLLTTDPSADVRREAAANSHLSDQARLTVAARSDTSVYVRLEAAQRLTDQAVMGQIARSDSAPLVRNRVVEKISDQAVLAGLANDTTPEVRLRVAAALTNQSVLDRMARTDPSADVKQRALDTLAHLAEQRALAERATKDPDPLVRNEAAARLTDQAVLAGLARRDPSPDVRNTAVVRLTDGAVVADLAKRDPSPLVRRTAINMLFDQRVLGESARTDADWTVRYAAVARLEDQSLLAGIAASDTHATVAEKAVSRLLLSATGVFESIARTGATFGARMAALERVSDLESLKVFATDGADPWIRALATLLLVPDPASDLDIRVSRAGEDGTVPPTKYSINLIGYLTRTSPLRVQVVKSSPAGSRVLAEGELSVDVTIGNRNTTVGYRGIRFKTEYFLTDINSKRVLQKSWVSSGGLREIQAGGRMEKEDSERDLWQRDIPPGFYAVTHAKFELAEATAFIRVPNRPGMEFPDAKDQQAVGRDHRYTIERKPAEGVTELTLGSPWRR